ncbi:hypothetical protein H5410_003304 [Solanum commersonii]|uniref:NADH-ubiquinone oxidoreductase chain 4L n=1 Tax=Solanum commersonii TaxID=4109 RepID=A0A9J6B4P3_SOLCO|nr:hypothetical protein H5410_003304 [Solanum commersonii]
MILEHVLVLSAYLFSIGIYGLITSRNIVRALMCLELILNVVNINFVTFFYVFDNCQLKGDIFSIFVIAIAAAEPTIGLETVSSIYHPMSYSVKIYDMRIGCTQCVRACPTDVLEMIPWDSCKAKQIASAPRTEDCVGSLIFFIPHKGNRVIRWYTICICILELLLTTYAFCYHFQSDDPLVQLVEDYKWIDLFLFPLEIRNRWTLYRTHFINKNYHYFSDFGGLASF